MTNNPPCVDCESTDTIKKGIKAGKQRYMCKDCFRFYSDESVTLKQKRLVIQLIDDNNRQEISYLGINQKTAIRRYEALTN